MRGDRRRLLPRALLACGLACGPAFVAASEVVVDFSAPPASPAPSDRPAQAAALRKALAAFGVRQPVALGEATLRVVAGAAARRARLVGDRDGSSGAQPWRALFVVLDGDTGAPWAWSLPADAGNAVHGALDLDGDGIDELLLRRDSAHMGVTRSDLVVWSLAGAAPRRLAEEPDVMLDSCDATVGARARSHKRVVFTRSEAGEPWRVTASIRYAPCNDEPGRPSTSSRPRQAG